MKKVTFRFVLIPLALSLLPAFCAGINQKSITVKAEEPEEIVTQIADVSKFQLYFDANHTTTYTIDTVNQSMTTNGAWDSAFLSTMQFETSATSYSLKTHVNSQYGTSNDGLIGFNLYFNNDNYVNFYLSFKSGMVADSIAEAVFLCHINGGHNGVYQYAKVPGGFITATTFTDIWSDFGGWGVGEDRDHFTQINMRGNSYIDGSSDAGFDMTLFVDRITYNGRLVDQLQYKIDGFANDRVTPVKYFSPKYVIDAITNPKGEGERVYAYLQPTIGFLNYNMGNVTYSNIVFKHNKVSNTLKSQFKVTGTQPTKFEVDGATDSIKYNNSNFGTGFISGMNFDTSTDYVNLSADVTGTNGDVNDTTLGFGISYDDRNYLIAYFRWSGAGTIDGLHILVTRDGESENVTQTARIPWESSYTTVENFIDQWSDHAGFITDREVPCGIDGNFNNIRSESRITIANGFRLGITKIRTNYLRRLVDVYQLSAKAIGLDGKEHIWYSPSVCIDAFTYPNGATDPSSLIDVAPKIGFYAYNVGEVTLSNIKFNGDTVKPFDPSQVVFGTREEAGWYLTGSDTGANWTYGSSKLEETWEELEVGAHRNEVTALTANADKDFYFGAELLITEFYGAESFVGIIPYYLDNNNYLSIVLSRVNSRESLIVFGKLDGVFLGGVEKILDEELDGALEEIKKLEIGINGNQVDIYFDESIKPTASFVFTRDNFEDRTIVDSRIGFVFFNASGEIDNYQKSSERIYPVVPQETDIPTIYENGIRVVSGYKNKLIKLPYYSALNILGEAVDVVVKVYDPNDSEIGLDNNTFTPDFVGEYHVSVSATDEWGHTNSFEYTITIQKYVDPLTPIPRERLWQTTFVLVFFGGVLALTIGLAVLLMKKNKKEAELSELLNKKQHEKNQKELVDEEE